MRLGPRYTPSPVPLEGVIGVWTAANTRGGLSLAGGQVTLTPDYLVFTPWDVSRELKLLEQLLTKSGVPHVGDADKLIKQSKVLEAVAIPLKEVAGIRQRNTAELLRPPTARIDLGHDRSFDLGILASPRRMNADDANNEAMADFLAKATQELSASRQKTGGATPTDGAPT